MAEAHRSLSAQAQAPLNEDTSHEDKGSVTTNPVTAERTLSKGLLLGE